MTHSPSPNLLEGARSVPSRDFMVRQAVLNALEPYAISSGEALNLAVLGRARYLEAMIVGDWCRKSLCRAVIDEFRSIAARYGARAISPAPSVEGAHNG